jgi:hypothetical protein
MGGTRGSGGVVSGDTDLGDLRGHPQGNMNWVGETSGGMVGWPVQRSDRATTPCQVIRLTWGGT